MFMHATITEKFIVLGGPESDTVTACINMAYVCFTDLFSAIF